MYIYIYMCVCVMMKNWKIVFGRLCVKMNIVNINI